MNWVDRDSLKSYLELSKEITEDNYPRLDMIIPMVESSIENYLGRYILQDSYTESFRIGRKPTYVVDLKGIPVVSIVSVTSAGEDVGYEITEWGLNLTTALTYSLLTVVYEGGFEEIPPDIAAAAMYQIAYENRTADELGSTSITTEGGTVSHPEISLLKHTKSLINNYRHVSCYGF